jgi:hypothetical protein
MTDMEAGRELDALVAEKVMGWPIKHGNWSGPIHAEYAWRIPEYSTDIAAAHCVIEKIMKTHFMYSLNASHESGHWCVFYPSEGAPVEGEYANTAALAICRAALATVRAA